MQPSYILEGIYFVVLFIVTCFPLNVFSRFLVCSASYGCLLFEYRLSYMATNTMTAMMLPIYKYTIHALSINTKIRFYLEQKESQK